MFKFKYSWRGRIKNMFKFKYPVWGGRKKGVKASELEKEYTPFDAILGNVPGRFTRSSDISQNKW
jgi:hypothetical protein